MGVQGHLGSGLRCQRYLSEPLENAGRRSLQRLQGMSSFSALYCDIGLYG